MVEAAALNDGRLGRRPLKNPNREIQAHHILLSRITRVIEDRESSIKVIYCSPFAKWCLHTKFSLSKNLAYLEIASYECCTHFMSRPFLTQFEIFETYNLQLFVTMLQPCFRYWDPGIFQDKARTREEGWWHIIYWLVNFGFSNLLLLGWIIT